MTEEVMENTMESTVEEIVEEVENGPSEDEEARLRQERVTACNQEMTAIMQKYGCTLDAVITLRAGQVIPNIQIVPIELMPQNQQQPRA